MSGLKTRIEGNYLVIYLAGQMDVRMASESEAVLTKLAAEHKDKNILLNLKEVDSFSSSGLRVLVSLQRILRETNRRLKLCHLSPSVRKVFEIIDLLSMFEIYDSEEKAAAD